MNINFYIELLQELGRIVVNDESVMVLQERLLEEGYDTEFVQSDRDYLQLIK